jgi:hypothetical protein
MVKGAYNHQKQFLYEKYMKNSKSIFEKKKIIIGTIVWLEILFLFLLKTETALFSSLDIAHHR